MSSKMEDCRSNSAANYSGETCHALFQVMEDIGENAETTDTSLSAEAMAAPRKRNDRMRKPGSLQMPMRGISETTQKTQQIHE